MILWVIFIAALVVIDQVSKVFVIYLLKPVGSVDIIPSVLRFTYVENTGMAFGLLSDQRWIFMAVSSIAIVALLIYLWKFRPESKLATAAICMITAGGIGNMIDRIFRAGVTASGAKYYFVVDFIDFYAFGDLWTWVFNIADALVCVGGAILVLWLLISIVKEEKQKKNAKVTVTSEVTDGDSEKSE